MCGIFGIYDRSGSSPPDQQLLDRATDLLAHRGPDGRGTWSDCGIGLGHRRLAIIDPDGSPQPMISGNKRFILVYNGEMYNYRELRQKLELEGVQFHTQGDTEVVLEALNMWGYTALRHFEGMFAFALWDDLDKKLFLARDRLGIKPLLYATGGKRFAFASEFRSLLSLPWVSREPDPLGVAGYLGHYQPTFNEHTIYRDIRSLDPGQCIICNQGGMRIERWWQLPLIPSVEKRALWPDERLEEAVSEFAVKMNNAVKSHMVADVPVGALLSGGIDSAVVITLMSEQSQERVRAYSIGFEEQGFNEFDYAVPLVKQLSLRHDLVKIDQSDYFPQMKQLISHKGAPLSTPNEVPLYALSRHLSKDVKVVLSGEGADELLGGYGPILRSPHDLISYRFLKEHPDMLSPTVRQAIRGSIRRLYGRIGFRDTVDHFLTIYSWLSSTDRNLVLNPDFVSPEINQQIENFWRLRLDSFTDLDDYDKYIYLLETEHLRGLLTRLDAETMAASVEGRVPFCDKNLVEFAWSLPFDFKLRWISTLHKQAAVGLNSFEISEKLDIPKYILKEAFRDKIPKAIIDRRKKAFPVPLEKWYNDNQNQVIKELTDNSASKPFLNHKNIPRWVNETLASGTGAMKVWMVHNLAIWLQKNDEM